MNFKKYAKYYEYFYKINKFLDEIKFVNYYLKKKKLRILDVGCGTGKFVKYLSKNKSIDVIDAIDPSKEMLKIAKKIKINKINFINKNFLNFIKKTKNSYDCITLMFHVINYIHLNLSLKKILINLKKITKKNSIIILDTWTTEGLKNNKLEVSIKKSFLHKNLLRLTVPRVVKNIIININFFFFKNNKNIFSETHKMKAISRKELEKLLIINNFKIIGRFKNFKKEKYKKNHLFLTLVIKRV